MSIKETSEVAFKLLRLFFIYPTSAATTMGLDSGCFLLPKTMKS